MNIKKIIYFFIPHFTVEKNISSAINNFTSVNDDLASHAAEWWKNDKYTQVKRFKVLTLFGIKLLYIPFKETIRGNYEQGSQQGARCVVKVIEQMQKEGLIQELKPSSIIFEPGCNVGTNLLLLQRRFGSGVVGMDISKEAITLTKEVWKEGSNTVFLVDNVLTTNYFDTIPDNFFDLCITKWHLIHIPFSESKKRLLDSLKRVSKVLVIFEPVRLDGASLDKVELYHGDEFCLSWDDWVHDYGLVEYSQGMKYFRDGTRIFFNANR